MSNAAKFAQWRSAKKELRLKHADVELRAGDGPQLERAEECGRVLGAARVRQHRPNLGVQVVPGVSTCENRQIECRLAGAERGFQPASAALRTAQGFAIHPSRPGCCEAVSS